MTPCFRTVKRWTADGRAVLVAIDEIPLRDGAPTLDPVLSLFDNVRLATGNAVEWEIARPGAVVPSGEFSSWFEGIDGALLVLDLLGIGRSGGRLYRAVEYHVPGPSTSASSAR